ncbi:unnamed protein product [Orchesella dallaii]|uniref:Uncharacterized protein n=1 Tax=Orchesella dallaii TaxID=48710 RepID=A0ABP1Q9Z9_9HEXA
MSQSSSDGSSTTEYTSPILPSSPIKEIFNSSTSSLDSRDAVRLVADQILVKYSHVNDALKDLKTEVYDDEGQEECHFVRIVRIGPGIKNKDSTIPGVLVVAHKQGGHYLHEVSQEYGEHYFLMLETDIKTYIDL